MNTPARSLAVLALSVLLASCAAIPPKKRVILPPERLFEALERDLARIESFRSWGSLALKAPGRSLRGRYLVAARSPGDIRFEVNSPLGSTMWVAVLTEGDISVFDASSNTFYHGKASPESISRFFGVPPMEARDLYNLILGRAAPGELIASNIPGEYLFRGSYLVTFGRAMIREMKPLQGGGFNLETAGTYEADGMIFPESLNLVYKNGARLQSALGGIKLNPPLDDRVFLMEQPRGSRYFELAQ